MNQKKHLRKLLLLSMLSSSFFISAQTQQERRKIVSGYNKEQINKLSTKFLLKEKKQKGEAIAFAKANNIPVRVKLEDGGIAELQRIENGKPLYYRTFNVAAAKSTRANHLHTGGSLGLNLNGQSMTAYVWDGGHARISHQEYDGTGGTNRVSVEDAASEGGTQLHYHSAHVVGTIGASGFTANAKGMAPQSKVKSYMWNSDLSEATTAAGGGMLLSNHSYGFRSDLVEDYYFGAYIQDSKDWDELLYNAPYYLMVVAAGNDGSTNYNGSPLNTSLTQYDKLTGHATSKNNLVVANANDANIDAAGNLVSVTINSSSSQGPTDDLRIKPDITGNGTSVYSTYETSDSAYASITGTSMASPNVTGTLLLLQQHYNNKNSAYMRSATLKGLAMHTADDAGAAGPDANFGWGLLNAKRAAEVITDNGNKSIISELTLTAGQTYTINVNSDGINKLIASICWTDPAGTSTTSLNSGTAKLVNDLDIRISKSGTTYLPWRLTGVNTNGLGDNVKDPFERIEVSGATGNYTITITHKGSTLTGNSQKYSLVVTGLTSAVADTTAPSAPTNLAASGTTQTTTNLSWTTSTDNVGVTGYDVYQGTTLKATVTTNSYAVTGLTASTAYAFSIKAKDAAGNISASSNTVNVTTSAPDTTVPTAPTNLAASGTTSSSTNLSWTASTDNVGVNGYDVYRGTTLLGTVTTTTYTATGLTANTAYTFSVKAKDAAGNVSASSNVVNVTTSSTSVTYCTTKGNNVADEYIDYVALGGIANTTGANAGYGNFTNLVGNVPYGSNTITFSTGFSGSAYTEYWGIWIDYNKNGTFETTEQVVTGSSSSAGNLTGTFTVPTSALAGNTRMRVSMKYNAAPTACETFSYGEVEDYTVNIGGGAFAGIANTNQIENEANIFDFTLYPNPTESMLTVSVLDNRNASFKISNLLGQQVKGGNLNQNEINVVDLMSGMYIFELNDGQKTITKKFIKK